MDAFSTGSKNTKYSRDFLSTNATSNNKKYIQTKGKLQLLFSADLKMEFLERMEQLKKKLIAEDLEKVHQLQQNIDQKQEIIRSAID
mmetsp:Transcript_31191/g.30623  ORF Transcript_31191/g.30623 Transcript_31191/m.30623 type:complete len:87 (+) Transcript_31191:888-1148(+)